MCRDVNWEDGCEDVEGLEIGEFGRRMVADQQLMRMKALPNDWRVTSQVSMTFD